MIICKAIKKLKDTKGNTIGYELQDTNGNRMNATSDSIKKAILNGTAQIENLHISSNGKLVKRANKSNKDNKNSNTANHNNKYTKLSYLKEVKVDKNTTMGYTNYSDNYDFNSPMQSFTYDMPITYYEGYIKDKNNKVYKVKARNSTSDSGRIAGGTNNYEVSIFYNNIVINLTGQSSVFGSKYGTQLIKSLKDGYYLEDYLTKSKMDKAIIDNEDTVNKIIENNTFNSESESDRQLRLEKERKNKFNNRYKILTHWYKVLVVKTDNGYKCMNFNVNIGNEISTILYNRHSEVDIGETIVLKRVEPYVWGKDIETNELVQIYPDEYKIVKTEFISKTIKNMIRDTSEKYMEYNRGTTVSVIGKLKYFKNKSQLIKFINDNKYEYTDIVDSYLHYLITNDKESNSAKLRKVLEYNNNIKSKNRFNDRTISIITEDEFIAMCRKVEN